MSIDNKWVMKKEKQRRSIYFKTLGGVATVDESDKVFGYLAAFGNIDDDQDRLFKGCFAKSIRERGPSSTTARKIAFLYAHNQAVPVGTFTMLEEQDKGLYYEATLSKAPFIQDTVKVQVKEKILNNHSVGYNYVWDKVNYNEDDGCFDCKELDTFEGSILTLGMNENTPLGGFKSWMEKQDQVKQLHFDAEKLLSKLRLKNFEKEYELRTIIQKYQSLVDSAAEEITARKAKPTIMDYKYIMDNLI